MLRAIWKVVTVVGGIVVVIILSSLGGGIPSDGHPHRLSGKRGPCPRIYAPTGRPRGYGPRTYTGPKWYS